MYLVSLIALSSLVFAIPQPVPNKIDELGKRGGTKHGAFYGIARLSDVGSCPKSESKSKEQLSVAVSITGSYADDFSEIFCPGIPVSVSNGTLTVEAMIINYCDCDDNDIEMNMNLFERFTNDSNVQSNGIPVIWEY